MMLEISKFSKLIERGRKNGLQIQIKQKFSYSFDEFQFEIYYESQKGYSMYCCDSIEEVESFIFGFETCIKYYI